MFLRDQDAVSVHVLACGACELLDTVARSTGRQPFLAMAKQEHPHLKDTELWKIRNKYWNAFKHLTQQQGALRLDDLPLLDAFGDEQNDAALFTGWWDYNVIAGAHPC